MLPVLVIALNITRRFRKFNKGKVNLPFSLLLRSFRLSPSPPICESVLRFQDVSL